SAEAAIAAVAELVEAVRDVYGDDCEQVCETSCPTCRLRAALAKFGGAACTLRDGEAKQPAAPSTPVRVSWADFWIAQGDWPTANDYAAFEKAEQWLLAQQPADKARAAAY